MKTEICESSDPVQPYYWRILAENNKVLATSETYHHRADAEAAANLIQMHLTPMSVMKSTRTYGPYSGVVTSEHDGDTIHVQITVKGKRKPTDIGWNTTLTNGSAQIDVDVRTFGDNADELATPTGQAALAYLASILPIGTKVTLVSHGWDKWGSRTDASITMPDGTDLVDRMIEAGFAKPWNGQGPKPTTATMRLRTKETP